MRASSSATTSCSASSASGSPRTIAGRGVHSRRVSPDHPAGGGPRRILERARDATRSSSRTWSSTRTSSNGASRDAVARTVAPTTPRRGHVEALRRSTRSRPGHFWTIMETASRPSTASVLSTTSSSACRACFVCSELRLGRGFRAHDSPPLGASELDKMHQANAIVLHTLERLKATRSSPASRPPELDRIAAAELARARGRETRVQGLPRVSRDAVRVGQRRGRPRHSVEKPRSRRW